MKHRQKKRSHEEQKKEWEEMLENADAVGAHEDDVTCVVICHLCSLRVPAKGKPPQYSCYAFLSHADGKAHKAALEDSGIVWVGKTLQSVNEDSVVSKTPKLTSFFSTTPKTATPEPDEEVEGGLL